MSMEALDPRREAFLRLAEKRTNAVIEKVRVLSNCSNRYAYDYGDDDVAKIFSAIEAEVRAARAKFRKGTARFALR
jgi:hypothetical protein